MGARTLGADDMAVSTATINHGPPAWGVSDLAAQQAAVVAVGRRALAGEDIDALIGEMLDAIGCTLTPDLVSVAEILPDGEHASVRYGNGWSRATLDRGPLPLDPATHGGLALRERRAIVVEDFAADDRCRLHPVLRAKGMQSGIAVPIDGPGGQPFGLLAVHWREPRRMATDEVTFLDSLAFVVGAALARRDADDQARYGTLHDPITELPNRLLFADRLDQALRRGTEAASTPAVLLLGLDRFRVINETLGNEAGDELLRAVTGRLRGRLHASETLARLGGDVFAVLADECGGERGALARADDLADALRAPFWLLETEVFVTATIGIAVASPAGGAAEVLLRDADVALYRGKASGGGHCELFGHEPQRRLVDRLRLEAQLRRALEDDQLRLAYQPIVSLADDRIVGVEALVRWEHPERGMVSPGDFIPLAEETGLVVPMGEWVLEEACRQLGRWSARLAGGELPYISVNVSARQLADGDFPSVVARVLARTGVDPERLALEITESLLMERTASPTTVLQELKDLGVRLFLDDFGTGYSSLSYLKRFPIDALKIDGSFVAGLPDGEPDRRIVEAIVAVAAALGLDLVAEGVETTEQADQLLDLGCPLAQGFLFARPLTGAAIEQLLRSGLRLERRRPTGARPAEAAGAAEMANAGGGAHPTVAGEPSVTLGEAADALGVSASTLRRWTESGRIRAVRTPGGHRRFATAEVSRLSAELTTRPPRPVRPLAPPSGPLPALRALLASSAPDLAATAARVLYGSSASGWFARDAAEEPLRRWAGALTSACGTGDYGPPAAGTLALARQAQLGGTTLLERHGFLEVFGDASVRALAGRGADHAQLTAARRLFVSLRQALLASAEAA